eukprot:SAG22_NODE_692_length_7878_cov_6.834812_3_plen_165_part_00
MDRKVFGRPIGANQGVSFPVADAHCTLEAAALMVREAAALVDAGLPAGPECNMAKLLAADASWKAGDVCVQTHGGYGFAVEFDIERKFRETRLYRWVRVVWGHAWCCRRPCAFLAPVPAMPPKVALQCLHVPALKRCLVRVGSAVGASFIFHLFAAGLRQSRQT